MIALLTDEGAASAFLEHRRWPDEPACPHCGTSGRMGRLAEALGRRSQFKCYACRKFSTARTGTMLEGSHLSSCAILSAIWLLIGSQGAIRPPTLAQFIGTTTSTALKLCMKLVPVLRALNHLPPSGTDNAGDAEARLKGYLAAVEEEAPACESLTRHEREKRLRALAMLLQSRGLEDRITAVVDSILVVDANQPLEWRGARQGSRADPGVV